MSQNKSNNVKEDKYYNSLVNDLVQNKQEDESIILKQSIELFKENIITNIALDKNKKILVLKFNHKYKNKIVIISIPEINWNAANKEYIEHLKKNNPDIEKIVIYKPIWLNELRTKVHSLLFDQQQQK
ncbi:MAG TPA: hypothetical protein VK882_00140, partial [Nitrososphaeraceae archaeon]|nr:hypothetical protein [Nitrososphaeraceae archaeon]